MNYRTADQSLDRYEFEELELESRQISEWYSAATENDVWLHVRTVPQRLNGPWQYHILMEIGSEPERVFESLDDAEDYLKLRFEVED